MMWISAATLLLAVTSPYDTNIPSEIIRSQPDPRVSAWVFAQDDATLHLSVVTIGELRKGLTILPESKRRLQLQEWLEMISYLYSRAGYSQ